MRFPWELVPVRSRTIAARARSGWEIWTTRPSLEVDTRSGRPRRTVAVGNVPDGLAAADGKLWVAGHAHGVGTVNVRKLDGRFYTRDWTKRIPAAGPEATDLALAGNELWVASVLSAS